MSGVFPYVAPVVGTEPEGRRERKKHQTAVALHDAAMRLFVERGYAETTVEDIADLADVSARTFFRYFSSKESVVFADEAVRRDLWVSALHARPLSEPVLESICAAGLTLADDYRPEKDFFRWELAAKAPSVGTAALRVGHRWENAIAAEVAQRLQVELHTDPIPRTVAAASMGAWRAAQRVWFVNRGRTSLAEHLQGAYAVLTHLGGLVPGGRTLEVRSVKEPVLAVRNPR